MVYDVVIIGSGPAGLTAAIYAKRAGLNHVLLRDKLSIDSQICFTYEVCNYPGFNNISGMDLEDSFIKHCDSLGVNFVFDKAIEIIDIDNKVKKIKTRKEIIETKTIILATGAMPKKGNFDGEDKFVGHGVSYCATCDGNFYKDKVVAVVGGGDVAVEDAIFMSRIAKHVYLIVRKNQMIAQKVLQEELMMKKNVEVLYETNLVSIVGDEKINSVLIKGINSAIPSELNIDGIFIAIGINPATSLLKDKVKMIDEYIDAGENCETSVKGIFAIGDIRYKQLRQVITACADGANSITSVMRYLNGNK